MRNLLKLQDDAIAIKVNKYQYPEAFVYNDQFYTAPEFVGNTEKVAAILGGYISTVLSEMKRQKKQFLVIRFDFCEANYEELQAKEQIGKQIALFGE